MLQFTLRVPMRLGGFEAGSAQAVAVYGRATGAATEGATLVGTRGLQV